MLARTLVSLLVAPGAAVALVLAAAGAGSAAVAPSGRTPQAAPATASPYGGFAGQLVATAAISPKDVWSVGGTDQPGQSHGKTLVEHWNGRAWLRVKSPNSPGSVVSSLDSVSVVSADDVWASGTGAADSGAVYTLMEHWDGTKWRAVKAPDHPGSDVNYLQAVSADSSTDAWVAADYVDASGVWIPYAEHWNGTKWKIVPVPGPAGSLQTFLTGAVAVSPTDAWIVGQCIDSSGAPVTLTEHWNGKKWSVVTSPNAPSAQASGLSSVAATSTGDVWAVGNASLESGATASLVEHWNGSRWKVVRSPNPKRGNGDTLSSVSAAAPDDVWAVGEKGYGDGSQRTYTIHWDGSRWSKVRSPNQVGAQATTLDGVSATSSTNAWATGSSYDASGAATTLNLRWNGKHWAFTP